MEHKATEQASIHPFSRKECMERKATEEEGSGAQASEFTGGNPQALFFDNRLYGWHGLSVSRPFHRGTWTTSETCAASEALLLLRSSAMLQGWRRSAGVRRQLWSRGNEWSRSLSRRSRIPGKERLRGLHGQVMRAGQVHTTDRIVGPSLDDS